VSASLAETKVLVVDVQATGASPARFVPIEIGWAETSAARGRTVTADQVETRLLRLPAGADVPWAVTRITGLGARELAGGHDPELAFADLARTAAAVALAQGVPTAPAVAHFARFEAAWLAARLVTPAGAPPPLSLVCTHAIAQRLFPDLPRRGLRALTGYFGRAVGPLRRAAEHVAASAFVWSHLVDALGARGIADWTALSAWLASPHDAGPRRRVYPMPRALRLSVPAAPGVYRMLRVGGDVLYVGKAVSLRARVNSWFRKQSKVHERSLEMLAQARDLEWTVTDTGVEAALLEADEIKRLRPPYNVALLGDDRDPWFASRDLGSLSHQPDPRHPVGPLTWRGAVDGFAALVELLEDVGLDDPRRCALASGAPPGRGPDPAIFAAGLARFVAAHPALERATAPRRAAALLGVGTARWPSFRHELGAGEAEAEEPPDEAASTWDPETTAERIDEVVIRAAHALRRARWLVRLSESTVAFRDRASAAPEKTRVLVIARGRVVESATVAGGAALPVPPGHARPLAERQSLLRGAPLDRLRVLTTELRRVLAETEPAAVQVCLGPDRVLAGARLARVLSWI